MMIQSRTKHSSESAMRVAAKTMEIFLRATEERGGRLRHFAQFKRSAI